MRRVAAMFGAVIQSIPAPVLAVLLNLILSFGGESAEEQDHKSCPEQPRT